MEIFILLATVSCVYLLPSIVAVARRHRQTAPIIVINAAFGWTLLGWFGCLAWSVSSQNRVRVQCA